MAARRFERDVVGAYSSTWYLFVIAGFLWLLLGFLLLSYRVSSLSITVVFIAVVFWMGAVSLFVLSGVASGGWRVLAIVGGLVGIGAGIAALAWPGPTLLVVSIFVAWYLLFRGLFDVVISLMNTQQKGWWLLLIAGIISFALGAWAIGNPDRSVLLLVTILGIYAIFHGVAELMFGFQLRSARDTVEAS